MIQSPDPVQQPGGGERQLLLDQPEVTIIVPITDLQAEPRRVVEAYGGELERLGHSWECILVYDGVAGEPWQEGLRLQAETSEKIREQEARRANGAEKMFCLVKWLLRLVCPIMKFAYIKRGYV